MSDQAIVVNRAVGTAEPKVGIYREFPLTPLNGRAVLAYARLIRQDFPVSTGSVGTGLFVVGQGPDPPVAHGIWHGRSRG